MPATETEPDKYTERVWEREKITRLKDTFNSRYFFLLLQINEFDRSFYFRINFKELSIALNKNVERCDKFPMVIDRKINYCLQPYKQSAYI